MDWSRDDDLRWPPTCGQRGPVSVGLFLELDQFDERLGAVALPGRPFVRAADAVRPAKFPVDDELARGRADVAPLPGVLAVVLGPRQKPSDAVPGRYRR